MHNLSKTTFNITSTEKISDDGYKITANLTVFDSNGKFFKDKKAEEFVKIIANENEAERNKAIEDLFKDIETKAVEITFTIKRNSKENDASKAKWLIEYDGDIKSLMSK